MPSTAPCGTFRAVVGDQDFVNTSPYLLRHRRGSSRIGLNVGMKPLLGNEGRYDRAADDRRYQDRVLALVDDVVR